MRSAGPRWTSVVAVAIVAQALVVGVAWVVVGGVSSLTWLPGVLAGSAIAALLVARRPSSPIAWILATSAVLGSLAAVGTAAEQMDAVPPGVLWAAWAGNAVVLVNTLGVTAVLLLFFPDGRLPTRRWRPVLTVVGGAMAISVVATGLLPGPLTLAPSLANPLRTSVPTGLLEAAVDVSSLLLPLGALVACSSVVVRFRRARAVERQQIKWLAYAAMLFMATLVATFFGDPIENAFFGTLVAIGWSTIPVAIGLAVLRYRLYDVDRIINRTLVYAVVTATLGGAYAVLVVVLQRVLSPATGDSDLAIALSTLAVAGAFGPLRARVQLVTDRRFNRDRYDAARVVETFGGRVRDHVDRGPVVDDLCAAVRSTVQPRSIAVWTPEHVGS